MSFLKPSFLFLLNLSNPSYNKNNPHLKGMLMYEVVIDTFIFGR